MIDDEKFNANPIKLVYEKIELVQNKKNLLEKNIESLDNKSKDQVLE